MKRICSIFLLASLLIIMPWWILSVSADDWFEEERGYYTLLDASGRELTMMGREMLVKDEYITSDNKHYTIIKVDKNKKQAIAEYIGDIKLPDIEQVKVSMSAWAGRQANGNILIYSTHTDESYIPSDGSHTKPANGGIVDVAQTFKDALESKGISAIHDRTPHDPHDSAAYRRSRKTAVNMIRKYMPVVAVFDIHRDAVPGHVYATKVAGEDMTKVRIVVGSKNQNRKANEELAYKIKAVADKAYPGLMKDIYIGAGAYNQELSPRSLLFEFGTHENSKESAKRSATYLADVIDKAMFGGTVQKKTSEGENKGLFRSKPIEQERTQGGSRGVLWLIILLALGGGIFIVVSAGGREMLSKVSGFFRQEGGGKKRE
jgi:stage II sporulation protein P